MRKKRVLWLGYKQLLEESDIPELQKCGYEIYTVKKMNWEARGEGTRTTTFYDKTLTLTEPFMSQLKELDFFAPIGEPLWREINKAFEMVVLDYYPSQFPMILQHFQGIIVLRTLGLSEFGSISEQIARDLGISIIRKIEGFYNRFWFAPAYSFLKEKEAEVFQQRYAELPLLVPKQETVSKQETELQSEKKDTVYVVCPQIKMAPESENLYWETVELLKGKNRESIPYCVGGSQYLATDFDNRIEGTVLKDDGSHSQRFCCMYLPQRRLGVVDTALFAAFSAGTPVLFSNELGLAKWDESLKFPGEYLTKEQAKEFMVRLLHGDIEFRKSILDSQKKLLEFLDNKNRHEQFQEMVLAMEHHRFFLSHKVEEDPQLGIVFLDKYSEATMRQVKAMVQTLKAESSTWKRICVGYPSDGGYEENKSDLSLLESMGVPLRPYRLEERDTRWLRDMLIIKGYPDWKKPHKFYVLFDGNTYFEDCSELLLVLNHSVSATKDISTIVSSAPIGVYISDYDTDIRFDENNRYIEAYSIELQRDAKFLLVGDENSRQAVIARNGVSRSKTFTADSFMTDIISIPSTTVDSGTILWFVNEKQMQMLGICEQVAHEYYLRGGEKTIEFLWQVNGGKMKRLAWNAQLCRESLLFQKKWGELKFSIVEDMASGVYTDYSAIQRMITAASGVVISSLFDMYQQITAWGVAADTVLAAVETPSLKSLRDRSGAFIYDLKEWSAEEYLEFLLNLENKNKTGPKTKERIFFCEKSHNFCNLLKKGFYD